MHISAKLLKLSSSHIIERVLVYHNTIRDKHKRLLLNMHQEMTPPSEALNEELHAQIEKGDLNAIRDLLRKGADINRPLELDVQTPLMMAASLGHSHIVGEFLKWETLDVNARSGYCAATALILAAGRGHEDVVCELLKCDRLDVNAITTRGHTALLLASCDGRDGIVRALLKHEKLDVNLHHGGAMDGTTALMWASGSGHEAAVRELLKHDRVDVNATDNSQATALIWACRLVGVNIRRARGDAAMISEIFNTREAIVRQLLMHKQVDVNAKDMWGRPAVSYACYFGYLGIIREFLKCEDVDVNVKGAYGNTALMWACLRGQLDVVLELLRFPTVNVHAKNKVGSTALDLARGLEMFEIATCLEEHIKKEKSIQGARS